MGVSNEKRCKKNGAKPLLEKVVQNPKKTTVINPRKLYKIYRVYNLDGMCDLL